VTYNEIFFTQPQLKKKKTKVGSTAIPAYTIAQSLTT
jgi:hypothetical protein